MGADPKPGTPKDKRLGDNNKDAGKAGGLARGKQQTNAKDKGKGKPKKGVNPFA